MIDFDSLQKEVLQEEIRRYPKHSQRASDLGVECERQLYYSIENWQDRMLHDAGLQSIFNLGKILEKHLAMERINKFKGIRAIEQESEYSLSKPKIMMHIDAKLLIEERNQYVDEEPGSKFPMEIKTVTPWDYTRLTSMEDFTKSKKHHQRAYVSQLQIYLLGTGIERGYMALVNKVTGWIKFIPAQIDIDFCDELIKKAERIEMALESKTPPERIDDFDICSVCAFRHICLPTMNFEAVKIMDKEELIQKLNERDALKGSVDRFKELDEEVKDSMKAEGAGDYIVGEFAVKVKERERKSFVMPESKYLETKIVRLGS